MATSGSTRTTLISPFQYFADPTRARPIFNGFIFIGRVDGDPTNTADQIPVQVICECGGSPVNVTQPIRTGPGGLPIYNGSPAQIVVCRSNYSITLQDNNRVQVYHSPNVQSGFVNQPITHTTLAAAMADDNSSRQVIKLLDRGGAEFRRAVNQAEFDRFPTSAKFTDAVSGLWVLNVIGVVDIRWFGAVPMSIQAGTGNELAFVAAFNLGKPIVVNDHYFVAVTEEHAITSDIHVSGTGTIEFQNTSTQWFAILNTNDVYIEGITVTTSNSSSVMIMFGTTELAHVENFTLRGITTESRISMLRSRFTAANDPTVNMFGIDYLTVADCNFNSIETSQFVTIDMPCKLINIKNNNVRNMAFTFINNGLINGATYISRVKNLMFLMVVDGNNVIADDDYFAPASGFFTFIVAEGLEARYMNNLFEGNKSRDPCALYDCYMSVDRLVHKNNVYRNNMCFNATKVNSQLLKGKDAPYRYYSDNTYVIEEEFITSNGGTLAAGDSWVTLYDHTSRGNLLVIKGCTFDIYQLATPASSSDTRTLEITDNYFKFKAVSGHLVFIRNDISTGEQNFTGHFVHVANNTVEIDEVDGTNPRITNRLFSMVTSTNTVSPSENQFYDSIDVVNNKLLIKDASLVLGNSRAAIWSGNPCASVFKLNDNDIRVVGLVNGAETIYGLGTVNVTDISEIKGNSINTLGGTANAFLSFGTIMLNGSCRHEISNDCDGRVMSVSNQPEFISGTTTGSKSVRYTQSFTAGASAHYGEINFTITPTTVVWTDPGGISQTHTIQNTGTTTLTPQITGRSGTDLPTQANLIVGPNTDIPNLIRVSLSSTGTGAGNDGLINETYCVSNEL